MNDETIVEVVKLKNGSKKFMRKTTANSKHARKFYKILRELTADEVKVMHELKTPDGNPFVPEYTEVITKTKQGEQIIEPKAEVIIEKNEPSTQITEPKIDVTPKDTELIEAKAKATELGIKYRSNIGLKTLLTKIEEHGTE